MEDNLLYYIIQPEDDERSPYKSRMKELNLILTMNGFNEIGDLFDPSLYSVNRTLNLIQVLLDDRRKMMESKSELIQKISRIDSEYLSMIEKIEDNKEKISEFSNKNSFLKNKINTETAKFKEEIEKMKVEKIELDKTINRLLMKDNKCKHEIKKNEKEIEDLKARLKKVQDSSNAKPAMNRANSLSNIINSGSVSDKDKKNNSTTINCNTTSNIENSVRNSAVHLHNLNHFKEFYNLVFQSLSEKVNYIQKENSELRNCFKLMISQINQFIEYKKLIDYKLSKDSADGLYDSFMKFQSLLNFNLFELDFNDGREEILNNYNEILNAFRYFLIYDLLKIQPSNEFEFDEVSKIIINKKYEFEDVPYYKQIKTIMDNFDFQNLNSLRSLFAKNIKPEPTKKKSVKRDEVFVDSNNERNITILLNENKGMELLEDINKEIIDSMTLLDDRFNKLDIEFEKIIRR